MRSPVMAVELAPGDTHVCQSINSAFWGYRPHQHDCTELMWIRSGRGQLMIGSATLPFAKDDVFLIGPRTIHSFYTEAHRPSREPVRALVTYWPNEASPLASCAGFQLALPLFRSARRGTRLLGLGAERVRTHLQQLQRARQMRALADFCQLVDLLCDCQHKRILPKAEATEASSGLPSSVLAAAEAIGAHLAEPLDLDRIAELSGMSRSALCAAFRRHYDRSPMAFLSDRRLARACDLLLDRHRRIVDVAYACGFNSLATFNRRFSRAKGVAPSQWRLSQPARQ